MRSVSLITKGKFPGRSNIMAVKGKFGLVRGIIRRVIIGLVSEIKKIIYLDSKVE